MLKLFIGNKNYSSWSLRPWILLRVLGIPFEEEVIPFGLGDFHRVSPTGRVPCLHDGDVTVWDSLSIVEYLAERHPAVWPSDRVARAFARSAAAEMHSGFTALRTSCSMSCRMRVRLRAPSEALGKDISRITALWNEGLRRFGGPYLAGGAFTAVDAFFAPVAFRAQTYGLTFDGAAAAYVRRLLELPAMREWYDAALAEPWLDEPHDAEIAALGDIVEDLRKKA